MTKPKRKKPKTLKKISQDYYYRALYKEYVDNKIQLQLNKSQNEKEENQHAEQCELNTTPHLLLSRPLLNSL